MPLQIIPKEVIDLVKALHKSGCSIRQIAKDVGVTHYRVRVIVEYGYAEKARKRQYAYFKREGFSKRQYLRAQAREQAKQEGVSYEEVYNRWGVPTLKRGPKSQLV